ncbi:DIP1984 family protein [Paeniglutamicibacter sp. NPDC012692]|uniref:DIP1984 family protein n=1 Tax=Paeniglutamicibacter sp. NPDC012692 TaxID=3364388 RepID=UPI00368CF8B8
MKLAEALAKRADLATRMSQISSRIEQNVLVQEGEKPAEDPLALLAEHDRLAAELQELIVRINATNLSVTVPGHESMTAALARRDVLRQQVRLRQTVATRASARFDRSTRSELRYVSIVDVPVIRSEADALAAKLRELDTRIQEANWINELS